MLVFPQWKQELPAAGCRVQRWLPVERFAPYLARPVILPPLPPQTEDEDSSGGSSPERESEGEATICAWRGCGGHFPSVARLSAHVARAHAHAHRDGLFYCGWKGCARPQRGFNARYKMLVHVRTHTNERPHTCNQCQKSFSRAENLKIHLRSHSGEKPYVCPYEGCGKAYSNSSDRFKHTRTHTVDKPYCCKVAGCNKRYTDPSSLRKHVKTYKHFVTEEPFKRDSDGEHSAETSSDVTMNVDPMTPLQSRLSYSPPGIPTSPLMSFSPMTEPSRPVQYPHLEPVNYLRPYEHVYPMRVPTNELTYIEYTQMYEHAYRNYYTSSIGYPVLRPSVIENTFTFEDKPRVTNDDKEISKTYPMMENCRPLKESYQPMEDMPLNLICSKRLECKPIEELVRRTDLPLDLSTKS